MASANVNQSIQRRTPWEITCAVWYAMFMREALARTTVDRFSWFWMLAEPIAMVVVMIYIRSFIMSGRHISGAEFIPWLIVGLLGFFLFRETLQRSLGAIGANNGLFAYRQVIPVDPVLVRCFLEGVLKSLILLIFIAACELLGIHLVPANPLVALYHWFALWCLGIGASLTLSAVTELIPDVKPIIKISMLPLLIISGVIIPLNYLPHWLQEYLLWNPIVHGLESLRLSFFDSYRSLDGVNMTYLWLWALSMMALGLMLHIRYQHRLNAQ
jgi:capsular polysaccharide transport system permease protein